MSADEAGSRGRHAAAVEDDERAGSPIALAEDDDLGAEKELLGAGEAPDAPPRRGRALRRVLIGIGILGLVLAVVVGGGLWFLTDRYAGHVDRIGGVFAGIENRPAPVTPAQAEGAAPITFLLMGSDTRAHPTSGTTPDGRSDAIILARLSGDRKHAQFVSIPRDSWVDVPGYGMHKINASYSYGGPDLLIKTVESLTNVRVDHFVAIDFDGINQVTDALGGVDVTVAQATHNGPYDFPAGVNHLTGDRARWYLGQRHELPGGDFDRERRQQQYLKAVFGKLFSSGTFTDPGKLDAALRALTGSVSVDDGLSNTALLGLAYSARDLKPADLQFFTAPVLGTGMEGPASVVYLNEAADRRMWTYLNNDTLGQNAAEFAEQQLPAVPN